MPLVYMNSWASLALRAAALALFGAVLLSGSAAHAIGAGALLLAAGAAHPLSVSLRCGGSPSGLASLAEGVFALGFATVLAILAARGAAARPEAGASVAPFAGALIALALVSGMIQQARMRREATGRWAALPVAIAAGSAGTVLLAALATQAATAGGGPSPGLALAALALAASIMHRALSLRRARLTAMHARQRDWALVRPVRPDPPVPTTAQRLDPAALYP